MTTVGSAKITFEADASGVSDELQAQLDVALRKIDGILDTMAGNVEQGAQRAGSAVGSHISDGAEQADEAVRGVGGDAFATVEQAAATVGAGVAADFTDAAGRADAALGGVDGGGFYGATAGASSAASSVAGRFIEEAGRADAALTGIDGDGFSSVTSASSRAAGSMRDVMQQAASDAAGAWRTAADEISGAWARVDERMAAAGGGGGGIAGKVAGVGGAFMGLAGATNVAMSAFEKNTSIEDTTAVLEVLMGSADEAGVLMDDLIESNWVTPIPFDMWADAGKTLVAFGMDADDVSSTVTALGEAGAASGDGAEGLQRLSRAFGQALATGVVQGDTLNQLAEAGVPALDILGNHYGKTAEEMKKMASEGLPAEEAIAVLTEGIMEGTDGVAGSTAAFAGTMEELAGTTSGVLGNLGAAFTNVASTAMQPLLDGLKDFAEWLTQALYKGQDFIKWVQAGGPQVKLLGTLFAGVATAIVAFLLPAFARARIQGMRAALENVKAWFLVRTEAWKATVETVKSIGTMIKRWVTLGAQALVQGARVAAGWVLAMGPVGWIIAAVAGVVAAIVGVWSQTEHFSEFWGGVWQRIKDAVGSAVEWITDFFGTLKGAWDDLVGAFTSDEAVEGDGPLGRLIGVDRANAVLGTLQTIKGAWDDLVGAFTSDEAVEGDGPLGRLIGVDRANAVLGTLQTIKGAWGEFKAAFTSDEAVEGNALGHLIGVNAANNVLGFIQTAKGAWEGLTALIFEGDYTGALWDAFGVAEDSPIIGAILTIREAVMDLPDFFQGVADILFGGDYTGLPFGLEEDSALVGILFNIRDAAVDLWGTVQDLWDTLVDLGAVFAEAWWETAKTVFESLATVGGALWRAFSSIAGAVWDLVQALAPVLLPVLKVIGGIIGGVVVGAFFVLMGALRTVAKLFGVVAKVVGWLAENVLTPLIGVISTVVSWLAEKLGDALAWVADLIGSVFENIGPALTEAWEWVQDTWANFTEWLAEAWEGLQALWAEYGQPVVDFVVGAFGLLWDGIKLYFRLVGAAWEVLWTALGKAWEAWGQPTVDFIVAVFSALWEGLQTVFGWVSSAWDFLWQGLQWAWDTFGQPVVDLALWVFNKLWEGLGIIFGWVSDGWSRLWTGAQNLWEQYGQPIIDKVSFAFEWVKLQIDRALWNIRNYIDLAGFKIRALWAEYVQPMVDRVTEGFTNLLDTIKGWKDDVIGWFSDAGSWLLQAGKDIVNGIIDGVTSMGGAVWDAFMNMLPDWVKDPFKKALGIESPSKVFAQYGRDIGDGLVAGVAAAHGDVVGATEGLADAALEVTRRSPAVSVPTVAPSSGQAAPGGDGAVPTGVDTEAMLQSTLPAFDAVGAGHASMAATMAGTADGVLDPMWAGQQQQLLDHATTAVQTTTGVVAPAWQAMGTHMSAVQAGVITPTMGRVQTDTMAMAQQINGQVYGVANPALTGLGGHLVAVQQGTINPAFDGLKSGMQSVADAFGHGARDVGIHMENMRRATADPVRVTMNQIFSDGLVEMWNSVSDQIGTTKMAKKYASFRTGGIMPGYTPGRDVHRFVSPTGGVLDLSGGEPVLRPEVGKVLGADWVHGVNSAARAEGTHGVARFLEHQHQHHASGGFVQLARGGYIPQTPYFGGSVSPIGRSHEAFIERFFPGVFRLTSANRPGDGGNHGAGRATDWQDSGAQWPTPASKALSRAIAATFPSSLELIHWPTDGWTNIKNGRPANYDAGTNAGHANHVHWATAGPVTADGITGALTAGDPINWDIDWGSMLRGMVAEQLQSIDATARSFNFPGNVGQVPAKTWEGMREPALDSMAESMEEHFKAMGDGGGAERWRPLAMQALARHGYNPAEHIEAMLQQIDIESSGIPNNWNLWDSNYLRGTPSGGLLQVIQPTYRRVRNAYPEAFEGLPDDMMFPLTNLTAGVGAVRMDWGGPAGRWPTRDGYEHGGLMPEGEGWFKKTAIKPERVLSPRQTGAFEQLVEDITDRQPGTTVQPAGQGGGGDYAGARTVREVHVTQNIVAADPKRTADVVESRLLALVD